MSLPLSCIDVFSSSFEELKSFYDKLDHDHSHFVNSNDICTPLGCVKEMADVVPIELWSREDLKVLDPCCGNGNFHAYIVKKVSLNHLYFNDINEKRLANIRSFFGEQANITKKNFLLFDDVEIYDLVVANPPYARFRNDHRVSKNHNLSRHFIEKALKVLKKDGYLLFIVPNNWMSLSDRNYLPMKLSRYQFLHLNIHGAKKWFPKVGSSFTWFLLKKTKNKNIAKVENHYNLTDIQSVRIDEGSSFIPLYYSEIVRGILKKTIYANLERYKIETSSDLHRTTRKALLSDEKTNLHRYKLHHTPTQVVWSARRHKYQEGWKVFISLTNQYGTFIDDCGMTQSIAFVRCNSHKEAQKIEKELREQIFHFINNITRYGNFNNIRILQKFPKLGTFELANKEKLFISQFDSKYYERKEKEKRCVSTVL